MSWSKFQQKKDKNNDNQWMNEWMCCIKNELVMRRKDKKKMKK